MRESSYSDIKHIQTTPKRTTKKNIDILVLNGSCGHSDQDGSDGSMAAGHQVGHRKRPRLQALCDLWWSHGNISINIDLNGGRIMDTDMVLYSSLGLAVSMTSGDHKGYPDQYGPSDSMACGSELGSKRWPRPLESAWRSTAKGAMNINTDPA